MRILGRFCLALSLLFISLLGYAGELWTEKSHRLLEGDYNGDGYNDLILVPSFWVPIGLDIPVIIPVDTGFEAMVLLNDSHGGYRLQRNVSRDKVNSLGFHYSDYQFVLGDLSGDGLNDLILQPSSEDKKLWLVQSEFGNDTVVSGYSSFELDNNFIGSDSTQITISPTELTLTSAQHGSHSIAVHNLSGQVVLGESRLPKETTYPSPVPYYALTPPQSKYRVLQADYNNDGIMDLVLDPTRYVTNNGTGIPILVETSTGETPIALLYDGRGDYTIHKPASLSKIRALKNAKLADYALVMGDLSGDGDDDLLLQPFRNDRPPILIQSEFPNGSLATINNALHFSGYDVGADTSALRIEDGQLIGYSDAKGLVQFITTVSNDRLAFEVANPLPGTGPGPEPSKMPGTIIGESRVDVSGAARYSLPLELAPGINGFQPSLSLEYNSNRGVSPLGRGWMLSGVSSISRCTANFADNGKARPVQLKSTDQYCLDGNKLVLISGTQGVAGSEYRTIVNGFEKVLLKSSGGKTYWEVLQQDGTRRIYGRSDDSVRTASGKAFKWAISRKTDLAGNNILYRYSTIGSESSMMLLDKIEYANQRITFKYNWAAHYGSGFFPGTGVQWNTQKQLNQIVLEGPSNSASNKVVQKTYSLTYGAGNRGFPAEKLLYSVQLCGAKDSCFAATRFSYNKETNDAVTKFEPDSEEIPIGLNWDALHTKGYQIFKDIELNGDGIPDAAIIYGYRESENARLKVWYGEKNGAFSQPTSQTIMGAYHDDSTDYSPLYKIFDTNGDGKDDIVVIRKFGKDANAYVFVADRHGDYQRQESTVIGRWGSRKYLTFDADGDGLKDIVEIYPKIEHRNAAIWKSNQDGSFSFLRNSDYVGPEFGATYYSMDINGDDVKDLVYLDKNNEAVELVGYANIDGSFSMVASHIIGSSDDTYLKMDLNGDGLSDFLMIRDNNGVELTGWLNNGQGAFITTHQPKDSIQGASADSDFRSADINQDGADDLLEIYKCNSNKKCIRVWLNEGRGTFGFYKSEHVVGSWNEEAEFYTLDMLGDGSPDILELSPCGSNTCLKVSRSQGSKGNRNKLGAVTDGLGNRTRFTYASLRESGVYLQGGENVSYPVLPNISNRYVVKDLKRSNGVGGYKHFKYRYQGERKHVQGIGNLGFDKRQIIDVTGKKVTVETYSQDAEKRTYGAPLTKRVCLDTDNRIPDYTSYDFCAEGKGPTVSEEITTWTTSNPYPGTYAFKRAKNIQRFWTEDREKRSATVNERQYDVGLKYGFITQNKTSYGLSYSYGNVMSGETKTVTESRGYNINASRHLVQPASVKVTAKHAGNDDYTTVNQTTWNYYSNGLLETLIQEPYTEEEFVTRYSDYYLGLPKTITESWANNAVATSGLGFTSRTQTISYDSNGYPSRQVNALGHVESFNYHGSLGKVLRYTDANGLNTSYEYNDLGFMLTEKTPALETKVGYYKCDANSNCASNTVYYVIQKTEGQPQTKAYYDSLGRERLNATQLLSGEWSYVEQGYNAQGLLAYKSTPYLEGESVYKHQYEYNLLGQVTKHNKPQSTASTTYQYSGPKITEVEYYNGKTKRTITEINGAGETANVTDHLNNTISYQYNGRGQLVNTTNVDNSQINIRYNRFGQRIRLDDPDKGIIQYTVNALGLVGEENKSDASTTYTYDLLGRLNTSTNSEGKSTWVYDTRKKGLLTRVIQWDYKEEYHYDNFGRLIQKEVDFGDDQTAKQSWQYDSFNRLKSVVYPGDYGIAYQYNNYGYLKAIHSLENENDVHWQALSMDAWGNVNQYQLDGSLKTNKAFDRRSGLVTSIQTSWFGFANTKVQDASYQYDDAGNLTQRHQSTWSDSGHGYQQQQNETYTYDALERLTGWTSSNGSNTASHAVTYAANGNITSKTGVGSYSYGSQRSGCKVAAGPHAVTWTQSKGNYCYDRRGNLVSGGGKTLSYTSFDKPKVMVQGANRVEVKYGPNLERYKRTDRQDGKVVSTTWYMGQEFERELSASGKMTERLYIGDFGFVERTRDPSQSGILEQTRYLLKDHIGSVIGIAQGGGFVLESQFTYDPWGKRTQVYQNSKNQNLLEFSQTGRLGFTGHEMLDPVGLIHMNGRVYDPELARFVTGDPIVSNPYDAQSYNRYSYVQNRPTAFTDPSGYEIDDNGNYMDPYSDDFAEKSGEANGKRYAESHNGSDNDDGESEQNQNALSESESSDNGSWWNNVLDKVQDTLDIVGMAPGVGNAADLANVAISIFRLDPGRALASLTSAMPVVGIGATGVRVSRNMAKYAPGSAGAAKGGDDLAKMIGQLLDAAKGKGNFGLGTATRSQADDIGKAWVGDGAKLASDGKTLVSKDGLRQYRPPTAKPNSPYATTGVQANLERRFNPEGQWQGNGHLDIVD